MPASRHPCVGCGYCCKKGMCVPGYDIYGLGPDGHCAGLMWVEAEQRYRCRMLEETTGDVNRAARRWLAIGAGCCSPLFNTVRAEAIRHQQAVCQSTVDAVDPEE